MKIRKKADLPRKFCSNCGFSFAWLKKWGQVWDNVRYCSERCRKEAKSRKKNHKIS
ncbi:MAG: DUF2256 domain-containing protein [Pseudomonadota bacterium]